MSDRERHSFADSEARARLAVASLGERPASPEFRARLREEFASGAIAARAEDGARVVPLPPRRRGLAAPLRWATAIAAAAAIVIGGWTLNAGPKWEIDTVSGDGVATVDGRPIPLAHTAELAEALTPGARIRVPAGAVLSIRSPGVLAIQMTSETDATIPPTPGRWFRRAVDAEIRSGEWRLMTGPKFHGARFAIATPSAHVEIVGTTLAVICEPEGTCVCVYEGRARVGRDATDMVPVDGGRRRYVYNDATREPELAPMRPTEAVALPEFRRHMAAEMGISR
jgi:ferric-dicitrate binding protein FerR (iron transport regulator)